MSLSRIVNIFLLIISFYACVVVFNYIFFYPFTNEPKSFYSYFSKNIFSSMASNLINIRWIRTGSQQFLKNLVQDRITEIFHKIIIKIIKLIPLLSARAFGPLG